MHCVMPNGIELWRRYYIFGDTTWQITDNFFKLIAIHSELVALFWMWWCINRTSHMRQYHNTALVIISLWTGKVCFVWIPDWVAKFMFFSRIHHEIDIVSWSIWTKIAIILIIFCFFTLNVSDITFFFYLCIFFSWTIRYHKCQCFDDSQNLSL